MADKKLTIHDDRDAEETGSIISLGFVLTTHVIQVQLRIVQLNSIPLKTARSESSISTVKPQDGQVGGIEQSSYGRPLYLHQQ